MHNLNNLFSVLINLCLLLFLLSLLIMPVSSFGLFEIASLVPNSSVLSIQDVKITEPTISVSVPESSLSFEVLESSETSESSFITSK
jgi:hypothetical protein